MDMRKTAVIGLLLGIMLGMGSIVSVPASEPAVVIVNGALEVDSLSVHQLRSIYLGKVQMWPEKLKVSPCYISTNNEVGRRFFKSVLSITSEKFKKHWLKRVFSGYGSAPKALSSPRKVGNFVAEHPGGIGMIPQSWVDSLTGIKVIALGSKNTF